MSINIQVSLCYQYNSEFYSKLDLLECVSKSIKTVDQELDNYTIEFDEIEEGSLSDNIHKNIHDVIEKSQILIFEISDLNQNVLYELGLAKGLKKRCILLKEESSKGKLPFDIAPFQYITYTKKELRKFNNVLAGKIKKIVDQFSPEDLLSFGSINHILSNYINPLKTNEEVVSRFNTVTYNSKLNLYYLGTIGFLTQTNDIDWIENLMTKEVKPNIYRIVFLKPLSQIYEIYKNGEILESYCKWLAKYYLHVKLNNIKLFNCPDVGIWKSGMSIVTSDENEVLILTGNFEEFNAKGIWINHPEIGHIFKEYSKILAIGYSDKIGHLDMIKFFDLSTKKLALELFENLPEDDVEDVEIERQCKKYIEKAFLENH